MSRVVEGFYVRFFWDWLAFISGAFRWKVFAVFTDDVGDTSSLSSHAALSPHLAFHSRASRASSDHLTPRSVPNACISSNNSANSLTRILLVDWPIIEAEDINDCYDHWMLWAQIAHADVTNIRIEELKEHQTA